MKTWKKLTASLITQILVLLLFTNPVLSQGSVRSFEFQTGMNSYMQLGSASSINFSRQTFEAWINIFSFTNAKEALFSNGTDCNILVSDTLSGSWYFIEYQLKIAGIWMKQKSKTHLVKNSWYHVTAAYDGYSMTIFINGNPDNRSPVANQKYNNFQSSSDYYIGDSPDTQFQNFTGLVDEVRIWSAPVEQKDLLYWMHIPLTSQHPHWSSLQRYFKCNDTGVTILPGTYCGVIEEKNNAGACTYAVVSRNYTSVSVYKKSSFPFTESFEGYVTPKTIAVYFNNKIHEFSSHNCDPYVLKMKGKVDAQNNVVMDNSSRILAGHKYEVPGACCIFKEGLAYVTLMNIDESPGVSSVTDVYHHMGTLANDGNVAENCIRRQLRICVPPAYAVLNDTLYFFNITNDNGTIRLNVDWSTDGINFKFLRSLNTSSTGLDYYSGNVAACTSRDNDGREAIFVGYIDRNHTGIQLKRFYRSKEVDETFITCDKVRNFSMVAGNVEGGISSGYTLQLFYSANAADNFGHSKTIGRIEYSIENNFAYNPEQLNIEGYDTYSGSDFEHRRFWPYAFAYYQTEGSSNETLSQKIIMTVQNNYQGYKTNWYLVWNSNTMSYIATDDISDTNPGDNVSRLLGIIEGPPPYVLNGQNLADLTKTGNYPSFLEFGSSAGTSNENTVSLNKIWKVSYVLNGLGEDYEEHMKSTVSDVFSSTEYENRTVFPVTGRDIGYKVFLRPIITQKKYRLLDGNGNQLDNIYTFNITDRFIDYVPYYLDTVANSPRPKSFISYQNRNIDFNGYQKFYFANYSWTGGSESKSGFETDSTFSFNTSEEIYSANGSSISMSVIASMIIGVSNVVFEFETRSGVSTLHQGSASMKNCRNISVNTNCPFYGNNSDTSHFSATVYWLKPTEGKNNWWIPKGYELHKPWCITYKVNSFQKVMPSVGNPLGAEKTGSPDRGFIIYPNPATIHIRVALPPVDATDAILTIVDMLGKEVERFDVQKNSQNGIITVPLDDLPAGVYACRFAGRSGTTTRSFVISR